jgi:hypothetical protein
LKDWAGGGTGGGTDPICKCRLPEEGIVGDVYEKDARVIVKGR